MDSPPERFQPSTYDTKLLEKFATSLSVSDDVVQVALTVWSDLIHRINVCGQEEHWFVCLLYIASVDLR